MNNLNVEFEKDEVVVNQGEATLARYVTKWAEGHNAYLVKVDDSYELVFDLLNNEINDMVCKGMYEHLGNGKKIEVVLSGRARKETHKGTNLFFIGDTLFLVTTHTPTSGAVPVLETNDSKLTIMSFLPTTIKEDLNYLRILVPSIL